MKTTTIVLLPSVLVLLLVMVSGPALAQTPAPPKPPEGYSLGCVLSEPGERRPLGLGRGGGAPDAEAMEERAVPPPVVDLSADGAFPEPQNQGDSNTCVAWAVAYYLKTYQENLERSWGLELSSHQFSPSFVYNLRPADDCHRDEGMTIPDAMNIIAQKGAASLDLFPFLAGDHCTQPAADELQAAQAFKAHTYGSLFSEQGGAAIDPLKEVLRGRNPFVVAIPVYESFFRPSCDEPLIDVPAAEEVYYGIHAVLVVGYDDTIEGIGGFKILNSYGPGWKCGGYAYLSYRFFEQYAWEGWMMEDQDATPPLPPSSPVEEHGVKDGVWQREVKDPSFTWTAAVDTTSGARYRVYWGQEEDGESEEDWVFQPYFSPEALADDGAYYLRVQAVDGWGNEADWLTLFTFRYDHTPPEGPQYCAEISGALNNQWQSAVRDPAFNWMPAFDWGMSGVSGYNVYWGRDSEGEDDAWATEPAHDPPAVSGSGVYFLRARAVDLAGNKGRWRTLFTLKYRADTPTPTLVSTATPDVTATYTAIPTPTVTDTQTPTPTPTVTATHLPTDTPTHIPSATPTHTPTPTPTPRPTETVRVPASTVEPQPTPTIPAPNSTPCLGASAFGGSLVVVAALMKAKIKRKER